MNTMIQIIYRPNFKYILNCVYNVGIQCDCNYDNFKNAYSHSRGYRSDRLHPLKNLRLFKYKEYQNRMKTSINLNMALAHAERLYSVSKAIAMDDYYY